MDSKEYGDVVAYLRDIYPFANRQWRYTRDLGDLRRVVYGDRDRDKLFSRIKGTTKMLFRTSDFIRELRGKETIKQRLIGTYYTIIVGLRKDKHLPDGVLDKGCIMTTWEEAVEYIQVMSPAVGDIIADWLEAEPNNHWAQKVAEKMKAIVDDYGVRLNA